MNSVVEKSMNGHSYTLFIIGINSVNGNETQVSVREQQGGNVA